MLTAAITGVVDHPCIKHEWLATTPRYIHVHAEHIEHAWTKANERVAARLIEER